MLIKTTTMAAVLALSVTASCAAPPGQVDAALGEVSQSLTCFNIHCAGANSPASRLQCMINCGTDAVHCHDCGAFDHTPGCAGDPTQSVCAAGIEDP